MLCTLAFKTLTIFSHLMIWFTRFKRIIFPQRVATEMWAEPEGLALSGKYEIGVNVESDR